MPNNRIVRKREASKTDHPLVVIMIVALLSFLGVLTETSMNVTFPTLMEDFNVSLNSVQWITSGYLLCAALIMLTSAFMKRRFTNRQLFNAAAIMFVIGDIMCGSATVFLVMLLGRLIQAGCVGLCTPLMINIIIDVIPAHKLGTYIGIANMITLIGPALGPTFGGTVTAFASWRMIFWITLPLTLVLFLIGQKWIKQYTPTGKYEFDWTRYAVLSVALISLILSLGLLGNSTNWFLFGGLLLITAIGFILFYRLSLTSHKALFSLKVFGQPAFLFSFLPYIMMQFSNVGINFLLPNYVQDIFSATAFAGGLILLPGSIFNSFGQPAYGWMLDHLGGKIPLYLGNGIFIVSVCVFTFWGSTLEVFGVTWVYMFFAIGRSMAFSNTMAYGLKKMKAKYESDANALYNTGQQVMGAIGTTILALMMSSVNIAGNTRIQNIAAGSKLAFATLLTIGIINMIFYVILFKVTSTNDKKLANPSSQE